MAVLRPRNTASWALVIAASALAWHAWMPAALVVGFLAWLALHRRFEKPGGPWRRAWPPPTAVLLLTAALGAALYARAAWPSGEAAFLPVGLNLLALLLVGRTTWLARRSSPQRRLI